ncbi:unnamed protein product [Parajaminaea phylloscopi]
MVAKSPFAASPRGIFQPTTSQDDIEEIQAWLGEQHTLFLSLTRIHQEALSTEQGFARDQALNVAAVSDGPSASHLQYYTRLFSLVIQSNRDLLGRLAGPPAQSSSTSRSPSPDTERSFARHISAVLLPILTLAQTLYASPNAIDLANGQGVVGEELLHWLNSYDLAPTTEQGREIASSAEPYQNPTYWDYILRCTLRGFHSTVSTLLATLMTLPSPTLVQLVERVRGLVQNLPRSVNFKTEGQFRAARRESHLQISAVLASLEGVMDEVQDQLDQHYDSEEEAEDLRLSLEAGLRVFLEVLAGNKERVVEAAEDWREALAAWATLVDVGLQRDGLGDALDTVKAQRRNTFGDEDTAASSQETQVEAIMSHLIKGDLAQACEACSIVDPYLAQVLTDFFTKLGLMADTESSYEVEEKAQSEGKTSLLERANLVYANTLLSTFGLWRMGMDYLTQAGVRGRARMSQVVLGVPLLEEAKVGGVDSDAQGSKKGEDAIADQEDEFGLVESVLEACDTFRLEREAKAVCRKISLHLSTSSDKKPVRQARYGPAVVYALRSPPTGDVTALKVIRARMLDDLLLRKSGKSRAADATSTSFSSGSISSEHWFIEQVQDIKRCIVEAQRLEAHRRREEEATAAGNGEAQRPNGPFLTANRFMAATGPEMTLLEDEDEWIAHFGTVLPAPVLFLTSFAHYFRLKARRLHDDETVKRTAGSPAAYMVELLNSGMVDGDWISIGLFEVGTELTSPVDAAIRDDRVGGRSLDPSTLYDVLRILESLLFNASLSPTEADFSLGKLNKWVGAIGNDVPVDEPLRRARRELDLLRFKVATAIAIPAFGPQDHRFITPAAHGTAQGGSDAWQDELLENPSPRDKEPSSQGDIAMEPYNTTEMD